MNIAEKLREEGYKEGYILGLEEARQERVRKTTLEIARTMLDSGFDCAMVMKITDLTEADLAGLRRP